MKIVYVARLLTRDELQLDGRALVRHFRAENDVIVCAGIVSADSELLSGRYKKFLVTSEQLADVDVVFMEGGWNLDGMTSGLERFRTDLAEDFVWNGGQLVVADIDRSAAVGCKESLWEARDFLHARVSYTTNWVGSEGHCYLYDAAAQGHSPEARFEPSRMLVSDQLRPALKGIDSLLVSGAVMLDGAGIAASGHETTQLLVHDEFLVRAGQWPWALANPHGDGHVVVVGGNITHDTLVDKCPDNARWLSNLVELLHARTREMAEWLTRADDARSGMNVSLEALLDADESQTLERKSSFLVATENSLDTSKVQHKVGRAIASLANTDGGWVIIGQDDRGNRLGLGPDFAKCKSQNRDGFLLKFKQYVTANMEPSWEALGLDLHWIQDPVGQILIIKVPRSSRQVWVRQPENKSKRELFVRRATITEALEGPDLVEWIATRG